MLSLLQPATSRHSCLAHCPVILLTYRVYLGWDVHQLWAQAQKPFADSMPVHSEKTDDLHFLHNMLCIFECIFECVIDTCQVYSLLYSRRVGPLSIKHGLCCCIELLILQGHAGCRLDLQHQVVLLEVFRADYSPKH